MSGNVVKSAARVFEVLELFSELQRPLSVREIATRCRYPGSSAAALLTSMKVLGYLAYDERKRMRSERAEHAAVDGEHDPGDEGRGAS